MAVNNLSINSSGYSLIKFGKVTIPASSNYVDVSLSNLPSNYVVVATPSLSIGVYITNKTTSGFRINSFSAPTSNMDVDYILIA